jgi:hypothetical protein
LVSVLQALSLKGTPIMPMRDSSRADKLKPHGFKEPVETPDSVELLTSGEFEVMSWLAAVGVAIALIFAAAYPAFDPAAALLGQFP